ncbi:MAG: alpha amylase C-terminal domain-containing protein, partial [Negativicutes bacterium]|nr:alpha amylase C-terminal domain-containing protein [Negativicutes bacterium]
CTGYFAPNSRLGSPHDLMFLIDRCHQLGIGVILDWVPGHFCRDPHGLAWYDGRPCYEYEAYRRSVKNDWGSNNFALGRKRVQTFLISSALFWLQYYHADGLRVDAVENMMRISGMRGNAGFRFLRKLNQVVAEKVPGAMMIAEDARPARQVTDGGTDGLGFTYRWNMGWCHDVLRFFRGSDSERHLGFEQFLFTLEYAHDENFVLSLSHDEAAYGRGSLLDKMPGDSGTRLKNLKLLLAWQICHPGKKLLFMGAELAQQDSWRFDRQLDWARMRYQKFRQFNEYVRQLNLIYRLEPGLWQLDRGRRGTSLEFVDRDNLVLLIGRHGWIDSDSVWGIFNFSGRSFPIYRVGWGRGRCRLLLCSEWRMFGGPVTDESRTVDCQPLPCHGQPYSLEFTLPAYSVCIFKPVG